jgi:hypothetical protein
MRKLLFLSALVIAGASALVTQPASATFKECVSSATEAILRSTKSICEAACKKEKDEKGCVAVCDGDYKHCSDKLKQKKADDEKADRETFHKQMACRKPYLDCVEGCPKGNGADNKKCTESCDKRLLSSYEACQDKTGPLVRPK